MDIFRNTGDKIVYNMKLDLGSAIGIRFYQEPQLNNPILVASWPGKGKNGELIKKLEIFSVKETEPYWKIKIYQDAV